MPESETMEITCIGCPNGCQITITKIGNEFEINGQECKRGEEYAIQEYTAPKRVLTTTIQVNNGILPLIPARSDNPLPKEQLINCMKYICKVKVNAPIKMGDILIKNILGLEANIVASRNLEEK